MEQKFWLAIAGMLGGITMTFLSNMRSKVQFVFSAVLGGCMSIFAAEPAAQFICSHYLPEIDPGSIYSLTGYFIGLASLIISERFLEWLRNRKIVK